jgi:predicted DNA-binding protein
MRKVETSIRFSPGTLERLKTLAHLRSLETGKTVTWNALVRDCVEKHLLGEGPGYGNRHATAGR